MPARLVFLLVLLSAFMVVPSALDLFTEWLWFNEVEYTGIFLRTLSTKVTLGAVVFLLGFAGLALNFRLALRRFTQPYTLFPGNGDIQPVVLTPQQLQRLATGIAALMALFLGAFASNEWLTWLQFQNAVPFDRADPLFGRDIGLLRLLPSVHRPRPVSHAGRGHALAHRIGRPLRHVEPAGHRPRAGTDRERRRATPPRTHRRGALRPARLGGLARRPAGPHHPVPASSMARRTSTRRCGCPSSGC